jgi:hypothetical protein
MIALEKLQCTSLGFLVKDTIAVGVELTHFKKVPCNGLERTSFVQKNNSSGSYNWNIDDFSQLNQPTKLRTQGCQKHKTLILNAMLTKISPSNEEL